MRAASRSTRRCLGFSAASLSFLLPSALSSLLSSKVRTQAAILHPLHHYSTRERVHPLLCASLTDAHDASCHPHHFPNPGHHADHSFLPFCNPACTLSLYNDTSPCPHHGHIHSTWRDNCQTFPVNASRSRTLGISRSTIRVHARSVATICIYGAFRGPQMKFSITAAVLALATAVSAQTINTPTALYTCEPYQIVWSGGAPPYYLRVLEGGTTSNVR